MVRLAVMLMVLGFGSVALQSSNQHFTLMAWADDLQPVAGLVFGVIGIGFLVTHFVATNAKKVAAERMSVSPASFAPPAAGYGPSGQVPPAGY